MIRASASRIVLVPREKSHNSKVQRVPLTLTYRDLCQELYCHIVHALRLPWSVRTTLAFRIFMIRLLLARTLIVAPIFQNLWSEANHSDSQKTLKKNNYKNSFIHTK